MIETKTFTFSSHKKGELINITDEVEDFISQAKIKDGICLIMVPHATATIFLNEDEAGVKEDIMKRILALAPPANYLHDRIDNNAQAHIIASIMGPEKVLPVEKGELVRGTWQDIFLVELDGPRSSRRVVVKLIGE